MSIGALILWAVVQPETAGEVLQNIRSTNGVKIGSWYMYVMAFYIVVFPAMAIWLATGRIRLGGEDSKTEFSWFSMMFGVGIGVGMLTYATAEPIYHFANNPDVIMGNTMASGADSVRAAMKW